MDILFYLLIAAFIGYVAYALGSLIFVDPSKSKSQSRAPASSADTVAKKAAAKPKPSSPAQSKPKPAAKKSATKKPKPAAKKPAAAKAKPKAAKPAAPAAGEVTGFRNPDTGEEARIPPSYPFSKRWVKDVLVKEGLLDKVYKNTELDDANTKKVTEALEKLKQIDKYVVRQ